MPRYIDAERFSERFDMMCDAGGVLEPVTEAIRKMVKQLIKAEPIVDVQLVKDAMKLLMNHCRSQESCPTCIFANRKDNSCNINVPDSWTEKEF